MKFILAFLAGTLLLGPTILAARAADAPPPTDANCPLATEPVKEYNTLSNDPNTPVDLVIASARRLIALYKECGTNLQSSSATSGMNKSVVNVSTNTGAEGLHYAEVRQAQFYVVTGRLERLIENYNTSHDDLDAALLLVKDVIDWRTPSMSHYSSNNVNIGSGSSHNAALDYSLYRDAALKIQDAAQLEITRLPKSAGGGGSTK